MPDLYQQLKFHHHQIQQKKPLILNLTNSVTQDFMANVLLAIGTAPIMSEHAAELEELATLAHGLNINIGTLNSEFANYAVDTAQLMQKQSKCIVMDPVGAGATTVRTTLAIQLLPYCNVVRGNASEIRALIDEQQSSYGVESKLNSDAIQNEAQQLALRHNKIIVVSGADDYIYSPNKNYHSSFGNVLMTKITGMGCCLSAVIAAFISISENLPLASHLAVIYYTLCAEQAALLTDSSGSFKIKFIDCLYQPDWQRIEQRISQEKNHV